ncbi:MAG: 2-hydroxy-acid oxidase, partial [Polynucleobacter sp. 17-46-58]
MNQPLPSEFIQKLSELFGERFTTANAVLEHHSHDESSYPAVLPQGVVFANTTEEIAQLVKYCNQYAVPIIPVAAGTSLEGHVLPIHGGIALNMNNMNQVLGVYPEDLIAVVQPAVRRKQLNTEL